jgi:DNA-binding FrmR family transcriptional regulator
MNKTRVHQSHAEIVRRLRRAEGHLRSIIVMIEEQRECLELAQQLHAVEKAVTNAKRTLIHDHLDHCLEGAAAGSGRASLDEVRALSKFL